MTLAASADGTTIADALLFVGAGAQPTNLLYVHADHLGSPQKMTDTSQATVWDGVFDPFGEEVAITGLSAMPMRFPGQYADDETGFSYNYFRDYEATLGRYIQPDPIGLSGGPNAYLYSSARPVVLVDRFGLTPDCDTTILPAGVKQFFETVRKVLWERDLPEPKLVGGGLGGDLPGRSLKPPIAPELRFEWWMVRYTHYLEETYRVTQEYEEVFYHCKETRTECGKTTTYEFNWSELRPRGDPQRELVSSRDYWARRPLYRLGEQAWPINPFPE